MPTPDRPLPKAIRNLLKTGWDIDQASNWHRATWAERRQLRHYDPAIGGTFATEELRALARLPLFAGLVNEDGSAINAGAEDALIDFCRETYAAFAKMKGRVADLREPAGQ